MSFCFVLEGRVRVGGGLGLGVEEGREKVSFGWIEGREGTEGELRRPMGSR